MQINIFTKTNFEAILFHDKVLLQKLHRGIKCIQKQMKSNANGMLRNGFFSTHFLTCHFHRIPFVFVHIYRGAVFDATPTHGMKCLSKFVSVKIFICISKSCQTMEIVNPTFPKTTFFQKSFSETRFCKEKLWKKKNFD